MLEGRMKSKVLMRHVPRLVLVLGLHMRNVEQQHAEHVSFVSMSVNYL